jgi:hypothetical protein
MSLEVLKSISFEEAFTVPADIWVLIDPDQNSWTENLDWEMGLLIRRSRLRKDTRPRAPLLLATPEGWPAPRLLVMFSQSELKESDLNRVGSYPAIEELGHVHDLLLKMHLKSVTLFAPVGAELPVSSDIERISKGEWRINWVNAHEGPLPASRSKF